MIGGFQIYAQRLESLHDLRESFAADAWSKIVDLLLQVRQADQLRFGGKQPNTMPLIFCGVLRFVDDD